MSGAPGADLSENTPTQAAGTDETAKWRIPFAERSKSLSETAVQEIDKAVAAAVKKGLAAAQEERPLPEVDVIGRGNGSRIPGHSGQDKATGLARAKAVKDAFSTSLSARTKGLARDVAAGRFTINPQSAGRDPSAATNEDRRVAEISLRDPVQSVLGKKGTDTVARIIHAIWLGPDTGTDRESGDSPTSEGRLSSTARDNLEAWQGKAAASGWRLKVWSNKSAYKANQEFYGILQGKGSVDINTVGEQVFPEDVRSRAWSLMKLSIAKKGFALASDVARYGILHRDGGVYVDVDIHPADVELPSEGLTGDKEGFPFLGPRLRDSDNYRTVLEKVNANRMSQNLDQLDADGKDALQNAVDFQYDSGEFANHFIVTPADSTFLHHLLENLPDLNAETMAQRNLATDAASMTGPLYIEERIKEVLKEKGAWPLYANWAQMIRDRRIVADKTSRELWDRLGWLTAESNATEERRMAQPPGADA
ncbi:glycosyltransferase [Streptomyces sp. NPDC052077]|uniref:glycosyltransferase n=1 Tax=Streptomyces sp. NPDC052077 TaxID=3154757 RepID=UPI0034120174